MTVEDLVAHITAEGIGMLVVDSLTKFWQLEASASDVQMARGIGILMDIARTYVERGDRVIHHTREFCGGGEDLLDVAGSYAVLAGQSPERRWDARG